jgi:hypothetical protein
MHFMSLKRSIEKRLLSSEDVDLPSCSNVLDANNWPKNVKKNIFYGEEEIRKLSSRFQLNERDMIYSFREYRDMIYSFREYLQLQGKEMPKQLLQLKRTLKKVLYLLANVKGDFLR